MQYSSTQFPRRPRLGRRVLPLALFALFALFALLGACGDDGSESGPQDGGPDAAPLPCSARMPLIIGQCIDKSTDEPCLDFLSTERSWPSLSEEPLVPSIVGLQGSSMFVLSVSGEGFAPGADGDAPYVELEVTNGGDSVGAYTSRPTTIDDPNNAGYTLAPQLYVVAFFAEDLVGQSVDVKAKVRDRNDDLWCTESSFQVGALIDAPPLP